MLVNDFLRDSADRFPDKVALVCDERQLTYAQIEEQTNRVGNGLLSLGVDRGDRVAVWLPNSVEAVIAIFGILKAGGFYLSLDPTFPSDRLKYILKDSGTRIIITDDENFLAARELSQNKSKLINLDDLDPEISDENLNLKIMFLILSCVIPFFESS